MPPAARNGDSGSRLSGLEAQFQRLRADMLRWRLEHTRYHAANETRWGLIALMRNHPFRTLAAGLALGAAVTAGLNGSAFWEVVGGWLR